ncbi:MAG: hypothetical protein ACYS22_05345 [Planctomycetota bacterium]|jgi:hypothetical protein
MSVSSFGGVSGPSPIEPEPTTSATQATESASEAAPQITRGSTPQSPFSQLEATLQQGLSNDSRGIISEKDAASVVDAALAQIADADDPAAALQDARGAIADARANLGRDADAAALLDGFEAKAATLLGIESPADESDSQAAVLSAIRDTFTSTDELTTGREIPTRSAGDVAGLPASVRESYAYFYTNVEEQDWGSARIYEHELGGEKVYAVTVTTDGDDGYIEAFDAQGEPLLSGTTGYGATGWDDDFGAVRSAVIY